MGVEAGEGATSYCVFSDNIMFFSYFDVFM